MIISKTIKVIEQVGSGDIKLERGQRIVDTRIIHEVLPDGIFRMKSTFPHYKTIIVLECVEYENDGKGA